MIIEVAVNENATFVWVLMHETDSHPYYVWDICLPLFNALPFEKCSNALHGLIS